MGFPEYLRDSLAQPESLVELLVPLYIVSQCLGEEKMRGGLTVTALFLNEQNRITYNELCRKCQHDCNRDSPDLRKLRRMVESCSEEEAGGMIRIFETVLAVLRGKRLNNI